MIKAIIKRLTALQGVLIKGAIFCLAWYLFPAWLFIPIALALYFAPFFNSGKFLAFFFAILGIYFLAPGTLAYALIGGFLLAWLLALKELFFIDRQTIGETLVLAITFFLFRTFFLRYTIIGAGAIIGSLIVAAMIGWMIRVLEESFFRDSVETAVVEIKSTPWISALIIWQGIVVGLFMPLDFLYQSIIIFLLAVLVIDCSVTAAWKNLSREKILRTASFVFAVLVLVITAAPWG